MRPAPTKIMQRDTTTFEIKGAGETTHTFEANTYLTAQENNQVQRTYFAGANVEVVGTETKINAFDPLVDYKASLKLIELLIVKMDDSTENIVERCEAMPDFVFNELVDKMNEITKKK